MTQPVTLGVDVGVCCCWWQWWWWCSAVSMATDWECQGMATVRTEGDREKEEDKWQACHLRSAGTAKYTGWSVYECNSAGCNKWPLLSSDWKNIKDEQPEVGAVVSVNTCVSEVPFHSWFSYKIKIATVRLISCKLRQTVQVSDVCYFSPLAVKHTHIPVYLVVYCI